MAPDVAPGAGAASEYARLSLWWEAVPLPLPVRPTLTEDLQVDVCIVGAGFTGLWTAHTLALADPTLRIVVLEREAAGFGGLVATVDSVRHCSPRLTPPWPAGTGGSPI